MQKAKGKGGPKPVLKYQTNENLIRVRLYVNEKGNFFYSKLLIKRLLFVMSIASLVLIILMLDLEGYSNCTSRFVNKPICHIILQDRKAERM